MVPGPTNTMAPARERIPYSLAARELLRNTLLDAACDELQDRRWANITMADIARSAGVSRQTLYKEFGSRDEFAQALVLREAERSWSPSRMPSAPTSTIPPPRSRPPSTSS